MAVLSADGGMEVATATFGTIDLEMAGSSSLVGSFEIELDADVLPGSFNLRDCGDLARLL